VELVVISGEDTGGANGTGDDPFDDEDAFEADFAFADDSFIDSRNLDASAFDVFENERFI
jgi:hypothetical protein